MSDRERAISIVENLPENKVVVALTYLEELSDDKGEIPNDETIAAFRETDKKLRDGTLETFEGSTDDFLNQLLEA